MANELKHADIDEIHATLLDGISDTYQKTQGFPTWDLLRATALGLKNLWDKIFLVEYKQDVDNLEGSELDLLIEQRTGLTRKEPVPAVGTITIVTGSGYVTKGDLFETEDGIQFFANEDKAVNVGDTVRIQAVKGGSNGNVVAGAIKYMPVTITGISKIINDNPTYGGYDEESDNDYRVRYYEYLQQPATAGNIYHYMQWAKEVDGVKTIKVIPCWAGKNTVKIYVVGADYKPASDNLVSLVQNHIDPGSTGEGYGTAPIGACCTVVPADYYGVSVACDLYVMTGSDIERIKDDIEKAITDYLHSIVYKQTYISYGHIAVAILSVDGVVDYENLLINGESHNLIIRDTACPVLERVDINV